jgi:hypothetical protein
MRAAALLFLAVTACGATQTQLERPPTAAWSTMEAPLVGSADAVHHAAVQILAERGLRAVAVHDGARTLVTGWWAVAPPVLVAWTDGEDPAARPIVDVQRDTRGVAQAALVVTVQAERVRVELLCRERVPTAPGKVPAAFAPCRADQRPEEAIAVAREVLAATIERAGLLPR